MTYYVSSGTLNPTHSLTHSLMAVQIGEDAALLQQLEDDSNSEDNDPDSTSAQVIGADDMLFSDFDADKDPKSLSPGAMESCLNEMQIATSRSHGSVSTSVSHSL